MKLNKTHKILLGIAIGGGIAYLLHRRNKAGQVAQVTATKAGSDSAEAPVTREGKIEYILANTEADASEEMTGFDGDRFHYDPSLGYALPSGTIRETDSGAEMDLSKEGNLANEIYFNAEGEPTDDPTAEAEAVLNELTDKEIDLAYTMVKAKKGNPDLPETAIAKRLGWNEEMRMAFKNAIKARLNDVKALKKSPKWKAKWQLRKARFKAKMEKHAGRGNSAEAFARKLEREAEKALGGVKGKKQRQKDFKDQVTDRSNGSMWGGHRNDGLPTDANGKLVRGNQPHHRTA